MRDFKPEIRAQMARLNLDAARELEIVEEVSQHLEDRCEELLTTGVSEAEARRQVLAELTEGNVLGDGLKRMAPRRQGDYSTLGAGHGNIMENIWQDVRYGLRMLWKSPGFTAVAVFTLALGIGANSAIFSVINAVLLKPLPYRAAERIMLIWTDNPTFNLGIHELPPSQRDITEWRAQAKSFERVAAVQSMTAELKQRDETKRIGTVLITDNFFATLGIAPLLGRDFTADDAKPGQGKVAIVSHEFWQREYGGASNFIGSAITLNNNPYTVVGIMAPGINFPRSSEMPAAYNIPARTEIWTTLAKDAKFWEDDENRQLIALGRLKDGVGMPQAQAEVTSMAARAAQDRPKDHAGWSTFLRPLPLQISGNTRPALLVLTGAVGFVLLIACANVANLLLCRSAARRKEIAIRSAIGAARSRVILQLLTESLLLSMLGGACGLLLGNVGLKALLALSPANIARLHEATFDGQVLGFSLIVTFAAGIIFGLAPAWRASQVNLSEALNASSRSNSAGGHARIFSGLVVSQVAIAVILLVGANLMLMSFKRLMSVNPGFEKRGVCAMDVNFQSSRYDKGSAIAAAFGEIRQRLNALPGVRGSGGVSHLPLGGSEQVSYFSIEGAADSAPGREPLAETRVVTHGYFDAMSVQFLRGRDFNESDRPDQTLAVVVNDTLARQFFPGTEALGKRIRLKESTEWLTIVGVIRDVRGAGLELQPRPAVYRCHAQYPAYYNEMTVVVKTETPEAAAAFEPSMKRAIHAIDPTLPLANFVTMDGLVSKSTARPRFTSSLLAVFAATALALTIVGLYGVVAYTLSQRTRELGIRMALGAQKQNVLRLVIAQGMRPALIGLAVGVFGAFGLTRFLASQLYEIKPLDPATFFFVSALFLGVAFTACWLAARRVATIDPMIALRAE